MAATITDPHAAQFLESIALTISLLSIAYDVVQPDRLRRPYMLAAYMVVAVSAPAEVLFA